MSIRLDGTNRPSGATVPEAGNRERSDGKSAQVRRRSQLISGYAPARGPQLMAGDKGQAHWWQALGNGCLLDDVPGDVVAELHLVLGFGDNRGEVLDREGFEGSR